MPDESFEDALGALTHGIRIAIRRALAGSDRPLPSTDLRSRAGVADPGRVDYRPNRLRDRFLRDAGDGDELNCRGERPFLVADGDVRTDGPRTAGDGAATRPVCSEEGCDRLSHVHLDAPGGR